MGLIKTVTEKPWERKGVIGGMVPEGTFATESERVALTFFLVIGKIFCIPRTKFTKNNI